MIAGGASSEIQMALGFEIMLWRRDGGGGLVRESDGTFNLRDADGETRTWSPDVSWISPQRLAELSRAERTGSGFLHLCPDFVFEVRSPSDSLRQQQRRMERWLGFGVRLGWLVDPRTQTVWLYRPSQEPESLERPAALSGESVLEGLSVDLAYVWELAEEDQAPPA